MTNATIEQHGDAAPPAPLQPTATRRLSPARATVVMALLLLVVTLLIYLWGTPPALWGDDWGMFNRHITGTLDCESNFLRPLGFCWMWAVFGLFGTNIMGVQVATVLLSGLLALLLFGALALLLPDCRLFNFGVALLFLLYPTDYTHNWIVGGNVKVPLIMGMLVIVLLLYFWRGGSALSWLAALALLGVSLFVYELHFGLIALAAGLLFLYAPALSRRRRALLLGPFVVMALFALWRWRAQLTVPDAFGHGTDEMLALTPHVIAGRLWQTLQVGLWDGWRVGLTRALAGESSVWLLPLVSALLLALGVWILYRRGGAAALGELPAPRQLLLLVLLGLLTMLVSSFPGLMVNEPGLHFERTRFNILPSIGAALSAAALLALLARLFARRSRVYAPVLLFGLLLLPVLLLAGGVQRQVNAEYNAAWVYHKTMMNQLLALAPDVADGTNFIVTLPMPDPLPLGPKPIASGVWGFSGELSRMYDRNLQASFRWGAPEDLNVTALGVRLPGRGIPLAYERVLIFHYDDTALRLIRELPQQPADAAGPRELCPQCILPGPARAGALRHLLE